MSNRAKTCVLGLKALGLLVGDISPPAPLGVSFVREAGAWIGRPMTPASYAGVARRTTRRVVAADTAAGYASAARAKGGPLPVGTVVQSLPSGCVPTVINGVQYYNCAPGTYCRAAFQGTNLVYVSAQPSPRIASAGRGPRAPPSWWCRSSAGNDKGEQMNNRARTWTVSFLAGAIAASFSPAESAWDPGINQPGRIGNVPRVYP